MDQLFWIVAAACLVLFVRTAAEDWKAAVRGVAVPWYATGNWLGWIALACFSASIALKAQGTWAMATLAAGLMAFAAEVALTFRALRRNEQDLSVGASGRNRTPCN
jgi:hypothetical protein